MHKVVVVKFPWGRVRQLDVLVDLKYFANRNTAIRAAVRDLLNFPREAGHFDEVEWTYMRKDGERLKKGWFVAIWCGRHNRWETQAQYDRERRRT